MKKEYNVWPVWVKFFSPPIYKYALKTFIPQILIVLFIVFYYSKLWWRNTGFDLIDRIAVITGASLAILTVFQIGSYFWIKKHSSLDLIHSDRKDLLTGLFFVGIPIIVLIISLKGYFK